MRITTQVSELTGVNESPSVGTTIKSSNRDFINRGVVIGVSVLTNSRTQLSGVITGVTVDTITSPVQFNPGDFFIVTLSTPWTVQNSDLPIIDVQCNTCGWSYPQKQLVNGKCKECQDKPKPV